MRLSSEELARLSELPRYVARLLPLLDLEMSGQPTTSSPRDYCHHRADLEERIAEALSFVVAPGTAEALSKAGLVLENGAVAEALLKLVAIAVRLPVADLARCVNGGQAASTSAIYTGKPYQRACILVRLLLSEADVSSPAHLTMRPAAHSFALKLLRMQTLKGCARQLAKAGAAVRDLDSAGAGTQGTATRALQLQAATALQQAFDVVSGLAGFGISEADYFFGQVMKAGAGAAREPGPLLRELAAALHDSQLMEHFAALVVHLPQCDSGGAAGSISFGVLVHILMTLVLWTAKAAPDLAAQFKEVLSGHCLTHAALACGLAALCAADGGPAYGLPPGVLRNLTPDPYYFSKDVRSLIDAATSSVRARRLSLRAAWTLLMRVPPLCRRSLEAAASAGAAASTSASEVGRGSTAASAAAGPEVAPAGERLHLPASEGVGLGAQVLAALRGLSKEHPAVWSGRAGKRWWSEALALSGAICRLPPDQLDTGGNGLQEMGGLLVFDPPAAGGPDYVLPDPLPPDAAAAVAAGWLPAVEHLVRRAGQDLDGPHGHMLSGLVMLFDEADDSRAWRTFAPALAHGDRRQAAALVVSLRKLLQRLVTLPVREGPAEHRALLSLMPIRFLNSAVVWAVSRPSAGSAAQRAGVPLAAASGAAGRQGRTSSRRRPVRGPNRAATAGAASGSQGGGGVGSGSIGGEACSPPERQLMGILVEAYKLWSPLIAQLAGVDLPFMSRRLAAFLEEGCQGGGCSSGSGSGSGDAGFCAHPGCVRLEGDSEADVKLQSCGKCRSVGYCCRECQVAHWREGHREECPRLAAAKAAASAAEAESPQPA